MTFNMFPGAIRTSRGTNAYLWRAPCAWVCMLSGCRREASQGHKLLNTFVLLTLYHVTRSFWTITLLCRCGVGALLSMTHHWHQPRPLASLGFDSFKQQRMIIQIIQYSLRSNIPLENVPLCCSSSWLLWHTTLSLSLNYYFNVILEKSQL